MISTSQYFLRCDPDIQTIKINTCLKPSSQCVHHIDVRTRTVHCGNRISSNFTQHTVRVSMRTVNQALGSELHLRLHQRLIIHSQGKSNSLRIISTGVRKTDSWSILQWLLPTHRDHNLYPSHSSCSGTCYR